MLDRHHCCVNNVNNKEINEFLKKHKIEPIHIPWRHRYFFDGGLHCLTLDLKRDTKMENYFPKRPNAGVIDYPIQPGDWY
jgi:glycine amidinotransferase